MDKHSQNSQNSKFTISLQHLIKEVRDEVDFLHADKHRSWYYYFVGSKQICLKYPKKEVVNIFVIS